MTERWEPISARQVGPGDRVRLRGVELTVARVEPTFLGRAGMIAFVEDTPARWLKVPTSEDAEVEVHRNG